MNNVFQGDTYRITILTNELIRLEYSSEGHFEDRRTKIVQNREFSPPKFEVIENDEILEILTDAILVYFKKGKFSAKNLFIESRNNLSQYRNRWYFGEKFNTLKGTVKTLDRTDGAIELSEGIISKNGFAILDDSSSFALDEEDNPILREGEGFDFYYFGFGRKYFKALKAYFHLTGQPPLLPRYALGNWWSRYWKYSEETYLELMDTFQEQEVPLSVSVIDMDWHITDVPERFGSGWTGYTWNKELFPNPEAFLEKLHKKKLKVTLNLHPANGIQAFEDCYPTVSKRLGLNQEKEQPAIFDLSNKAFRETYFEDVHHPLEKQGVDFWWIDWQQDIEGEMTDFDSLWLLNHYHYKDINRSGKNNIILSRFAGPGSHRFPVGFSGDTVISWKSLAFQPYFTSTASNIGYTWWSHDIGGHRQGYHDEELATRWIQFGVFSPINRLHSSPSIFNNKEPWSFSKTVCQIMKKFLTLRHQMLPYLYTMNVKTHEESYPLITPMYYHYPMKEESYHVPNQYFFGTELMVMPITSKTNHKYKTAKVEVWFPEGEWFDFFTDVQYSGDTKIGIFRPLDTMPVFAKAGSIIPLDPTPALTGTELPKQIDWHIFPGDSNEFELIEDEGDKRCITSISFSWATKTVTIAVTGDKEIVPASRVHQIIIHRLAIDPLFLSNTSQSVKIKAEEIQANDKIARIVECLRLAEMDYDSKNDILCELKEATNLLAELAIINKLEPELRDRIFEILYTCEH